MVPRGPRKRRAASAAWLATLACSWVAPRARAEDTRPLEPAELRSACLADHEAAQLARLDGKLVEAKRKLGACAFAECPSAVRADCTQWLAEVNNAIPSVVLAATSERGDEAHVHVYLDGAPLTDRLDGKAFELNPGQHRFRFELPPYAPREESLLLREGERERLVSTRFAALTPVAPRATSAASAPPPVAPPVAQSSRPVPWITYALGGLAVAAVGTTTYFGLHALSEQREKLDSCAPLCESWEVREVERPALAADISIVVAVLAGGGAIYTYWTRPTVPVIPPNSAFLSYSGVF